MIGLAGYGLRLPRLWLLGCAAASALILGEYLLLPTHAPEALPVPPAAVAATSSAVIATPPPIDAYAEIAARPLFVPTRRPEPPDQTPTGPPPAQPTLVVLGIAMTDGTRYAVVRHGNPPKIDQVTEGETIDGWQIQAIKPDGLTLRSESRTAQFPLGAGNGLSGTGQPQPARRSFGGDL